MEATGQRQEAHRLVVAVGFSKSFRDHLVSPAPKHRTLESA